MATNSFYPIDGFGRNVPYFTTFSQALPLITFCLSFFSSAFGMSRFLLNGPLSIVPKSAPFAGMLSAPFLALLLLNSMFCFRLFALEAIFFASYQKYSIDTFETFGDIKEDEIKLLLQLQPGIMYLECWVLLTCLNHCGTSNFC